MRPRASNEKELQTPCLKALAALFSRALVDCLRAAIAFSAAPTRSAPIWPFHLSYTGRVALTKASRSAGESCVTVTPRSAICFRSGLSASTTPLRAMAISSLPASMAAWRTASRSAGVQLFHTSLLTTKISGSFM